MKKRYIRSSKKAKEVKFSDFQKKDPVLSQFKELEELPVLQRRGCPRPQRERVLELELQTNLDHVIDLLINQEKEL